MKKFLKWFLIIGGSLLVLGFLAFLYPIPPFDLLPREEFIKPYANAIAASLPQIDDPAQRLLAERGRYIVTYGDCNGCHTPNGDQGPKWEEYLAGGMKFSWKYSGIAYSRNLTPDKETGIGSRTDEEIKRVLRSGVFHNGRPMEYTFMPWTGFSNMTEEDRHAVVVYLRNIHPKQHEIPEWSPTSSFDLNNFYPYDYGKHELKK